MILSLSGGGGGGGGGSGAALGNALRSTLNGGSLRTSTHRRTITLRTSCSLPYRRTNADLLERLPENFQMLDVEARAQPLLANPKVAPFVLVCMQVRSTMGRGVPCF